MLDVHTRAPNNFHVSWSALRQMYRAWQNLHGMRQKDLRLGAPGVRKNDFIRLTTLGMMCRITMEIHLGVIAEAVKVKKNIIGVIIRSRHISMSSFNLYALSDMECLGQFRFMNEPIGVYAKLNGWARGVTRRHRYGCKPMTATCIVPRRLSFRKSWFDLKTEFCMHSSKLSKVFWEVIESLRHLRGHLLQPHTELLYRQTELYAQYIRECGAPLDRGLSFLDYTRIRICWPGGQDLNQRFCYLGNTHMNCLIF